MELMHKTEDKFNFIKYDIIILKSNCKFIFSLSLIIMA